jgi:hypothetical protein
MRDVAERTGVHERRLPFERLHDVRLIASFITTVIAPATFNISAVTGSPSYVYATTMRPRRRRRSDRLLDNANTAITSDAAVMMN